MASLAVRFDFATKPACLASCPNYWVVVFATHRHVLIRILLCRIFRLIFFCRLLRTTALLLSFLAVLGLRFRTVLILIRRLAAGILFLRLAVRSRLRLAVLIALSLIVFGAAGLAFVARLLRLFALRLALARLSVFAILVIRLAAIFVLFLPVLRSVLLLML